MRILDSDHCVAILPAPLELTGRVSPDSELAITALVTHNQKHFSRLTNLAGLVLEDWLG